MIDYTGELQLLSAETKVFEKEGESITYYPVRVSLGGEIYPCKSTKEQISSLVPLVGKIGTGTVQVVSRKETISLRLVDFKPNKA